VKITEHFDDSEFKVSEDYPELAKKICLNETDRVKLFYICRSILEPAREVDTDDGQPIWILSGKRTPELNKAVGGATNSDHLFLNKSCAVDFTMDHKDTLHRVYSWIRDECSFLVGEMIIYFDKKWIPRFIHISLPTKEHWGDLWYDYNQGERFESEMRLPVYIYMDMMRRKE